MKLLSFLMATMFLLIGCDKVVKRELLGESSNFRGQESCSHWDYCYDCGYHLGFSGSMEHSCGFRHSSDCPGSRSVIFKEVYYLRTFESGLVDTISRREVLERGECR